VAGPIILTCNPNRALHSTPSAEAPWYWCHCPTWSERYKQSQKSILTMHVILLYLYAFYRFYIIPNPHPKAVSVKKQREETNRYNFSSSRPRNEFERCQNALKTFKASRPIQCRGAASFSHDKQIEHCAPLLRQRSRDFVVVEIPESSDAHNYLGWNLATQVILDLYARCGFYIIATPHSKPSSTNKQGEETNQPFCEASLTRNEFKKGK
jgi:hypothetical protein